MNTFINIGIIISIILGSFLHFAYDISGKNKIIGYFTPVNESVWEHMKLSVFPVILTTLVIYIIYPNNLNNLIPALAIASLLPFIIIPILFYTYTHFTKKAILPVDISIFIISVIVDLKIIQNLLLSDQVSLKLSILSFIILIFTLNSIFKYTYNPPKLKIFKSGGLKLYLKIF